MRLPLDQRPQDDPTALWQLQNQLLTLAESLLGSRDATKKIYQPSFGNGVPHIINTPNWDGAFVELSSNASGYWPTTVYEMGHETVHLLNPGPANANYLEEGIAVEFALLAMERCGCQPYEVQDRTYAESLQLVRQLPMDVFAAGKLIRQEIGEFRNVDVAFLQRLFPESDRSFLCRLSSPFPAQS